MTLTQYWDLFIRTGDPMAYMQYRNIQREEHAASDNQRACDPRN